jgi:type I restriction-modification system DNA methylase subunit
VIKMLRQKSCPRCKKGDIGVDRDQYGWYEYCIQCGYTRDLVNIAEPEQERAVDEKKAACGVKKAGEKADRGRKAENKEA